MVAVTSRRSAFFGALLGSMLAACSALVSFADLTGASADAGGDARANDAGILDGSAIAPSDASNDAAPVSTCDPTTTFGAPTLVSGVDTAGDEMWGRLSGDELEIVYQSSGTTGAQIFLASRANRTDTFGPSAPIAVNDPGTLNYDPMLSLDNVTLIYSSQRDGGPGGRDLWRSTRPDRTSGFGPSTFLTDVNSDQDESQPYQTVGNAVLWFGRDDDLYFAVADGTSFLSPTSVPELNTTSDEQFPVLTTDGLYLYFSSNRPGAAGMDVWLAHRATTSEPFNPPVLIPELNSTADDWATWISPDNCRIYLTSSRGTNTDIYVAERSP